MIAAVLKVPEELSRGACVGQPAEWWDTELDDLVVALTEEGLPRKEIIERTGLNLYRIWRIQVKRGLASGRAPNGQDEELRGVRICWEECEVRRQCLDYALRANEQYGVWGGVTPSGRKKLSRVAL